MLSLFSSRGDRRSKKQNQKSSKSQSQSSSQSQPASFPAIRKASTASTSSTLSSSSLSPSDNHFKSTAPDYNFPTYNDYGYPIPPRSRSLMSYTRKLQSYSDTHSVTYMQVEQQDAEKEKQRLSDIYKEYEQMVPGATISPRDFPARPSRSSSLAHSSQNNKTNSNLPASLSVDTNIPNIHGSGIDDSADTGMETATAQAQSSGHTRQDSTTLIETAAREIREKERQREVKRKAALFELVDTERSFTNDLRMVVELFLLPIQLLGNRKIVDVIFGDMVKITEMNGKMYFDMVTRLGPLACFVDPERASRNRRKKKNIALKSSAPSHVSGHPRSVLHGSSIRTPTSPASARASASATNTMARRLSNPGDKADSAAHRLSVHSANDSTSALDSSPLSRAGSHNDDCPPNGDEMSIAASSNSGGSSGYRYLSSVATDTASAKGRHDSVRSLGSMSEEDEDDATKWKEDQVLRYFKNVCIGDVMANYLKDFSELYALYSANHDKAIEYLKLVRESSSRLNLRSDVTRDAHQKLLQTLENAEKDNRVRRLRLESFLLAPVQRVMRYPLLLEALLKYTPEDHPDHDDVALALSIAGSVATEVDRKSEELMNRQRLSELQTTFDWAHLLGGVQLKLDTFTKLVGQRKFVRKGPLRKASSGKHLYAILFNDFMMITMSDRRGGVWCYEPYRLPIQTYDLLAREPVKDQFELVNLKNGEVLQLRADTPAEATDWVKDIMKTSNYCYEVMCEALRSGIQVSKVKSVISPEAREKILQGGKPSALGKRY
ncbi:hypothetical protein GGI25_005705 [Coemansia spiralis]|uniref:Dbl homology domain-containing protein n=2 Tax=Coemansia TaxID=4863 RepID=A0A9W8FY71_9FUNG|nr:hypothetical protein BX070DRAFT_232327 [Coemansia spiralis]KAJ1988140.1 hypothetical protein EDC05_005463 [Coemansia umbellata]KAJ2625569.1 hypothetical protein GGI26_000368 [Coemansia sp. RSA 1358]KAJ2670827.1 hypothetical protein GGI25_005705 [Coemansia spiralis]